MRILHTVFLALTLCCAGVAQEAASTTSTTVPHIIRFSGQVKGRSGTIGITFTLHRSQDDKSPLWSETQNVKLDGEGRYNVLLGSTRSEGIPSELFTSAQAQWLAIRVEGQPEQPRVLLVSVPYAMKAGEAETFAGRPLSAFVLSGNTTGKGTDGLTYFNTEDGAISNATSGTANYIGVFTNTTDLGNSVLYQNGAKVGLGTTSPAGTLHVVSAPGSTAEYLDSYSGSSGSAPATPLFQRSARGTPAAPSAIQTNDMLGGFLAGGYNGTALTTTRAGMVARAYGAWTSTSNATYMSFFSTPVGGTTANEAMRIASTGYVGIGTTSPLSLLDVNGTANFRGLVTFASGQTFPGTQQRVTGTCAAGNYVRAINADGTVTCGVDVGGGSVSSVTATVGSGLSVSNPTTTPAISTDFTVIAKVQSCPSGQVIQSVGANGTAACVSALSALPSGFSILGSSPVAPAGYTMSGFVPVGGGPWADPFALNSARTGAGVGVIGSTIYAAAGTGSGGFLGTLEKFDTTAPGWHNVSPSSGTIVAREQPGAAVSSRKIATGALYIFGGYGTAGKVANADVYNPATNTWAALTNVPISVAASCVVSDASGFIYIIGGDSSTDVNGTANVYKYDPSTDAYAPLAPMTTGTFNSACTFYNGKIYVFGGYGGTFDVNALQIYDIAGNSWTSIPYLPYGANPGASAVAWGSLIYYVGGNVYGGCTACQQTSILDGTSNTIIPAPPSSTPHYDSGLVIANGLMYAVGGRDTGLNPIADTTTYNPNKVQWSYTKN